MRNKIKRRSHDQLIREVRGLIEEKPDITDYGIGRVLNISFATRKKYCEIVRSEK